MHLRCREDLGPGQSFGSSASHGRSEIDDLESAIAVDTDVERLQVAMADVTIVDERCALDELSKETFAKVNRLGETESRDSSLQAVREVFEDDVQVVTDAKCLEELGNVLIVGESTMDRCLALDWSHISAMGASLPIARPKLFDSKQLAVACVQVHVAGGALTDQTCLFTVFLFRKAAVVGESGFAFAMAKKPQNSYHGSDL